MKQRISGFTSGLLLLLAPASLFADSETRQAPLQWPAIIKPEMQISSTFGESRVDHFHNGVDIPGEGLKVLPVKEGEVLWYTEGRQRPNELPFGGGRTLLLRHGNLVSGYMHLKSIESKILKIGKAGTNDILGLTGNTGHSGGPHLHFFVFDIEKKKMYNPLLLLPPGHAHDTQPPVRKEMVVILPDRLAVVNPEKEFTMSGDYPVGIRLVDSGLGRERWGVYTFRVQNKRGDVTHEVKFDILQFKDGRWVTSGGLNFDEVFRESFYLLGKNIRQMKTFSVHAGGYTGPAYSETFDLKIILQ